MKPSISTHHKSSSSNLLNTPPSLIPRLSRCTPTPTIPINNISTFRSIIKSPLPSSSQRTTTNAIRSLHANDSNSSNDDQPPPLPLSPSLYPRLLHIISSFYKFTRPHTMLGTLISVISVSLLALTNTPLTTTPPPPSSTILFSSTATTFIHHILHSLLITMNTVTTLIPSHAWMALLQALSSALLMNICIVGINQLYDIEIDKINKPYLPLAAGDFTPATGTAIVIISGILSLAIGIASGSIPLLCTLCGSLFLGIAYSTDLPFLRWKRNPIAAAACILAVRAVLVQLGFYLHMQHALGSTVMTLTRPVLFATCFMLIFSIVIAFFKDIPDVSGDERAGVKTLSVRLGQKNVFWACIMLLDVAYMGAVCVALGSEHLISRIAAASTHVVMAMWVWWRAYKTDVTSSKSIYDCYMDVWKAFYIEYLLLPLMR